MQVKGEHEVRYEDIIPFYQAMINLVNAFDECYINYVP